MFVSASIVAYKTDKSEIEECLKSLHANGIHRIIVSDNSPNDALRSVCEKNGAEYIFNGRNLGYGAGHNVAIKRIAEEGAKYHLALNSDVVFADETVNKLREYMERNDDVGLVIPNVIYPNGERQYACRLLPSPFDLFLRRFVPSFIAKKRRQKYLMADADRSKPINAPFLLGSFMFMRVEALKDVGLFDERFFMYMEDADLSRRIHTKYKTISLPEPTISHAHCAASYRSIKMLLVHLQSAFQYFCKWGWLFDGERKEWNENVLHEIGC